MFKGSGHPRSQGDCADFYFAPGFEGSHEHDAQLDIGGRFFYANAEREGGVCCGDGAPRVLAEMFDAEFLIPPVGDGIRCSAETSDFIGGGFGDEGFPRGEWNGALGGSTLGARYLLPVAEGCDVVFAELLGRVAGVGESPTAEGLQTGTRGGAGVDAEVAAADRLPPLINLCLVFAVNGGG